MDVVDLAGSTALHLAAYRSFSPHLSYFLIISNLVDVCEVLVQSGATLEIQDNEGMTPLHWVHFFHPLSSSLKFPGDRSM